LLLLILGPLNAIAGTADGVVGVVIYYVAMMRLAWLYTPVDRRVLGPLFWTRRAAAIPLIFFFGHAGILSLAFSATPH
jgi:hypothetical protein